MLLGIRRENVNDDNFSDKEQKQKKIFLTYFVRFLSVAFSTKRKSRIFQALRVFHKDCKNCIQFYPLAHVENSISYFVEIPKLARIFSLCQQDFSTDF